MLKRLKPDPVPSINPVPEYRVEGRRKELYEATKQVLQVPWMGVVTMALADYQEFYEVLWQTARPIMQSAEAIEACRVLRAEIEAEITKLNPPKRIGTLENIGYSPRETDTIRQAIDVFSHGNFLYTMMATFSRLALEEGRLPDHKEAKAFDGRHAPDVDVPFVLVEEHHADDQTRQVYASIRETLGLPFVNTDYRALARWPSYFRIAWGDLAPVAKTKPYEEIVAKLHHRFVEEAIALPNPTGAPADALKQAAERSASLAEVLEVNRLFQWLLPGLIVNVAYFREQLREDGA